MLPFKRQSHCPTQLAGISLKLSQLSYGKGLPLPSLAVPIVSIAQKNTCIDPLTGQPSSTALACVMTSITVQIPFEIVVDPFTMPPYTSLTVTQDGVVSPSFNVATAHDNVHILTCSGQPCITHADGTLLSAGTPLVAGETLTVYVVGLGAATPAVPSGQPTPTPAPTIPGLYVDLVFGANAGPGLSFLNPPPTGQPAKVTFAGLTPGQIGLYQINFQLPTVFPSIPQCGVSGNLYVASNLAINVETPYYSHDGVAICVQP
ncbi:MAG: hypothetical protein WDO73_36180 [Ignavibacteriota bacterium]